MKAIFASKLKKLINLKDNTGKNNIKYFFPEYKEVLTQFKKI